MKILKSISALLPLVALSGAYALDLTPHEIVVTGGEAPGVKRYFIEEGGQRYSLRIDNKMSVSGASASLDLRFADMTSAAVKLARSPMRAPLPFDEKNLETYRISARSFIPPDAQDIQAAEDKPNAIAINGWTSYQFSFTYTLFGLAYQRSITFVNFSEQEQLVLDVSSAANDYPKTYTRGYRVLNSLTPLTNDQPGPT